MLVHPLLRRFVVMSGGHCTLPTGAWPFALKTKKADEAQKAKFFLSDTCGISQGKALSDHL